MFSILGIVSGTIALLITIFGFIIGLNGLSSRSDIGQALFTDEQKLKVYYYRLFMLSIILSIETFVISLLILIATSSEELVIDSYFFVPSLVLAFGMFILALTSLGRMARWYQNFFIKDHYKFRISSPGIGDVFIIRMLNTETCICSRNPNAGFKENSKKIYLVPIQEIMKEPILKTRHPKPKQTFKQKIFS